jgi:hypothetical protein
MAVKSALRAGRPLPRGRFVVLIPDSDRVNPRVIVRLEGLGQLKNPITSSGIETATFYFKFWLFLMIEIPFKNIWHVFIIHVKYFVCSVGFALWWWAVVTDTCKGFLNIKLLHVREPCNLLIYPVFIHQWVIRVLLEFIPLSMLKVTYLAFWSGFMWYLRMSTGRAIPRSFRLNAGWLHLKFVMDEVALNRFFGFTLVSFRHCCILICRRLLSCTIALTRQHIITFAVFYLGASSLTSHMAGYRIGS